MSVAASIRTAVAAALIALPLLGFAGTQLVTAQLDAGTASVTSAADQVNDTPWGPGGTGGTG